MASYADELRMLPRAMQQDIVSASKQEGRCRDCAAESFSWCDVRHGVLLCTRCAGKHRGFEGVRVKSLSLDAWTPAEVEEARSRMAEPLDDHEYARAIDICSPKSRKSAPRGGGHLGARARTVTPEPPSLLATAAAGRSPPRAAVRRLASRLAASKLARAVSDPATAVVRRGGVNGGAKAFANQINVCTPNRIQEPASHTTSP